MEANNNTLPYKATREQIQQWIRTTDSPELVVYYATLSSKRFNRTQQESLIHHHIHMYLVSAVDRLRKMIKVGEEK